MKTWVGRVELLQSKALIQNDFGGGLRRCSNLTIIGKSAGRPMKWLIFSSKTKQGLQAEKMPRLTENEPLGRSKNWFVHPVSAVNTSNGKETTPFRRELKNQSFKLNNLLLIGPLNFLGSKKNRFPISTSGVTSSMPGNP